MASSSAVPGPVKTDFTRYVALANKGARELGFADNGAMWREKYDMPPDAFAKEVDRLWEQVRPLYVSLHAYVRWKLREKYGDAVPAAGPIPAHLLGNMWAQDWENIYPLVAPAEAVFMDAKVESELTDLPEDEARELLESIGQPEPASGAFPGRGIR